MRRDRRPKILVTEPLDYSKRALGSLRAVADVDVGELDRCTLLACIADYDAVVVRLSHRIDRDVLDRGVRLKVIASPTTGLDHIDLRAASERGIEVISLRTAGEWLVSVTSTAELAWALVLSVVRRVPAACRSVQDGTWDRAAFKGHQLSGMCLGVVGLGRLGSKVAEYGRVFGMTVMAYDPHTESWPDWILRCSTLEELLASADVVSVHVPGGTETRGLLGSKELGAMKHGSYLVNTSRSYVVDEVALAVALESGQLAGAGVDVMGGEPDAVQKSPLWPLIGASVVATPHIGGATHEAMALTEEWIAREVAVRFRPRKCSSLNSIDAEAEST